MRKHHFPSGVRMLLGWTISISSATTCGPLQADAGPETAATPPAPESGADPRGTNDGPPVGLNGMRGTHQELVDALANLEWQSVESTDLDAQRTLEDLYHGQTAWRDQIHSVWISFQYASDRRIDTPRDVERARDDKLLAKDYSMQFQLALKGRKRYTRFEETPIEGGGPPSPTYIHGYNGEQARSYEPRRSLGQIHPALRPQIESLGMWYFDAISWPVGETAERQRATPWYIPTALENSRGEYRVLPKLQRVDDALCHVVTSGWDTLWIDADHGCALRRRIWFQRTSEHDPGCLRWVFVCRDFVEANPGIWLPAKCRRLDFGSQLEPETLRGRLLQVNTVTAQVDGIHVNDVPDSLFEIEFPPGTEVMDLIANRAYVVPHGEELLDKAITDAAKIVDGEVLARTQPHSSSRWILGVANLALLLVIAAVAIRRRRMRAGPNKS